jgi:hypothetical protein
MTNRIIASALSACVLAASVASAEPSQVVAGPTVNTTAPSIRESIAAVRFAPARARQTGGYYSTPHKNSVATRASAAFVIGMLGTFGGAMLGGSIGEIMSPNSESGGLQGMMIGMPVGAVLGAIAGWNLAR